MSQAGSVASPLIPTRTPPHLPITSLLRLPLKPLTGSMKRPHRFERHLRSFGPSSLAPWDPWALWGCPTSLWTPGTPRTWPTKRRRVYCQRAGSCSSGCPQSNNTWQEVSCRIDDLSSSSDRTDSNKLTHVQPVPKLALSHVVLRWIFYCDEQKMMKLKR